MPLIDTYLRKVRLTYSERNSAMEVPFNIGIEEEYQMVDRQTGQLSLRIHFLALLNSASSICQRRFMTR